MSHGHPPAGGVRRSWLLAMALWMGCTLGAVSGPAVCAAPAADAGVVRLGRQPVMRFCGDKRMSARKRARLVQSQLNRALAYHLPPRQIAVQAGKGRYTLVWGGHRICTVDPQQARFHHTQVKTLAFSWVRSLRHALAKGYLSLVPDNLRSPVGGVATVHLEGAASGPLHLEYDHDALKVGVVDQGRALRVSPLLAGSHRVKVRRQGSQVSLTVLAKEYAGEIPDQADVTVTGSPASHELLEQAALQAARRVVTARSGATISLRTSMKAPVSLALGGQTEVHLPLRIEGAAYYPLNKTLKVHIRNEVLAQQSPSRLLVSNRPEKIEEAGVLFRGAIRTAESVRLLYSHINGLTRKQMLIVTLANRSPQDARLLVLQADGGPARQELRVGQTCNARYLGSLARSEGLVVTIPSMKAWELGRYELGEKDLVSGLCQLQMLAGEGVEVTVETCPQATLPARVERPIDDHFNPFCIHPKGVYLNPNLQLKARWIAGEHQEVEVVFGQIPWLIDPITSEPNTGNYGVLYDVDIELSNPSAQRRGVNLLFEPLTGVACGSFLIDGKLVNPKWLKLGKRASLESYTLEPGQTRKVHVQTLPQAGSHYPARLVLQSQPTEAKP